MKRIWISLKSYLILLVTVLMLVAGLYILVSKHRYKIPDRAMFVYLPSINQYFISEVAA